MAAKPDRSHQGPCAADWEEEAAAKLQQLEGFYDAENSTKDFHQRKFNSKLFTSRERLGKAKS